MMCYLNTYVYRHTGSTHMYMYIKYIHLAINTHNQIFHTGINILLTISYSFLKNINKFI